MSLSFKVYHSGPKAIFDVTSTIIYGEKDAFLVDAQFQKSKAKELVEEIRKLGKTLKVIYISHFDPDYYFGLSTIHEAFPEAEVLSTAQTAWMISATMDAKLGVWKGALGKDSPEGFIVPTAVKALPLLENHEIRIIRNEDDETHSILYVPSTGTILGGVSLAEGNHPWMADTRGLDELDKWITQVETMKALSPKEVIASHHYGDNPECRPSILDCTLSYLKDYREALASGKTADAITAIMTDKYPSLGGKDTLTFGARVITGVEPWERKNLYPGVDHHVMVDFMPASAFDLDFHDNRTLTFTQTDGGGKGYTDTMDYTAVEVADHVFMVHWQETNGIAVVHLQNWNTLDV